MDIRYLTEQDLGQKITIRGRVHNVEHAKTISFIILRYQTVYLQIVVVKKILGDKFDFLKKITTESILECCGTLRKSEQEIKASSYSNFEMDLLDYKLLSLSESIPFQVDDFHNNPLKLKGNILPQTKLENRWLDLRSPINNSIFRVQSGISHYFRDYLLRNNFMEIHSPKIIGVSSEGGAEVFKLDYFGKEAFLAQSPQLYKQMAINSDFDRVFEIGPVFRAEESLTNRHMCEFVGMDLEMTIAENKDYTEVQEMIWNTLVHIFDNLKVNYAKEIECVKNKKPFDDPMYTKEPLIIKFSECVKMLRKDGKVQDDFEDLNTENERRLGEIVKDAFNSDLFIIDSYPSKVRPFYTMDCEDDSRYSNSFDIIFRCTEICSGAQRIHDYQKLLDKVKKYNINPNNIKHYLNSFSHGSIKHGGCGFGLNRITSLYLNLGNVKLASLCPRDPNRLFP